MENASGRKRKLRERGRERGDRLVGYEGKRIRREKKLDTYDYTPSRTIMVVRRCETDARTAL